MWWMFGLVSALAADSTGAVEPHVLVEGDGTVVTTLVLQASESAVRAAIGDGVGASRLSPDVLSVSSTPSGRCQELTKETRGMFRPFRMKSVWCASAAGWTEELVTSEDFTSFHAEWTIAPTGSSSGVADAATRVTYRVRTDLAISVPDAMLQRSVAQASGTMLERLAARVLRGAAR
ncbi:MAG: hypothetical protein H0V89_06575 [Deltaproteobacteria bacterium]|nr:hypothetical protein [Deltaproteobacteria bacterium]